MRNFYCEDQHYLSNNYYRVYKFTNCYAYNLCYWIVWLIHSVYINVVAFVKPIIGNSAKYLPHQMERIELSGELPYVGDGREEDCRRVISVGTCTASSGGLEAVITGATMLVATAQGMLTSSLHLPHAITSTSTSRRVSSCSYNSQLSQDECTDLYTVTFLLDKLLLENTYCHGYSYPSWYSPSPTSLSL